MVYSFVCLVREVDDLDEEPGLISLGSSRYQGRHFCWKFDFFKEPITTS